MKIAVASDTSVPSSVAGQAGRARYYLVYDGGETLLETLTNPFSVGGGGAGFGVAKMLADKDVEVVIAGTFGDKMERALQGRGMTHVTFTGTVADALSSVAGSPT